MHQIPYAPSTPLFLMRAACMVRVATLAFLRQKLHAKRETVSWDRATLVGTFAGKAVEFFNVS